MTRLVFWGFESAEDFLNASSAFNLGSERIFLQWNAQTAETAGLHLSELVHVAIDEIFSFDFFLDDIIIINSFGFLAANRFDVLNEIRNLPQKKWVFGPINKILTQVKSSNNKLFEQYIECCRIYYTQAMSHPKFGYIGCPPFAGLLKKRTKILSETNILGLGCYPPAVTNKNFAVLRRQIPAENIHETKCVDSFDENQDVLKNKTRVFIPVPWTLYGEDESLTKSLWLLARYTAEFQYSADTQKLFGSLARQLV